MNSTVSLSELLGSRVVDSTGTEGGRLREVTFAPQDDPARVAGYIVRTREGDRVLPAGNVSALGIYGLSSKNARSDWAPVTNSEGFLLLERDLLDQQIIDVHGRKVVRVNDVDFIIEQTNGYPSLKISQVEIGPRGAVRRLLKGIVPRGTVHALMQRFSPKVIPWNFVNLIETDPARRVKLKIGHERLSKLHPADIADILEDLAPAQREAIFETLDENVAANALEEINPKMQASLVQSLDSDHAADIVEEMDPDAAADLLDHLPRQTSEDILEEMEPKEREDVEELLEFEEDTAAGRMTTDFISVPPYDTVEEAIERLRSYEGGVESISTIYLVDANRKLVGAVPLSKIAMASPDTPLETLSSEPLILCHRDTKEHRVAELFDKYNLITLPVVDEAGRLNGVITADDVISLLRAHADR